MKTTEFNKSAQNFDQIATKSTMTANFNFRETTKNGQIAYESADASCSSRREKTVTNFMRTREVELENNMLAKLLAKQVSRKNPFDKKNRKKQEVAAQ